MEMTVGKTIPTAAFIAFSLALFIWHAIAAFLGVFIANRLGVSEHRPNLIKMSLCSLLPLSLFLGILYFTKSPIAFLIYIVVFVVSLKLAYLGMNPGFLLIVLGSAMAGLFSFAIVFMRLGVKGMLFLYLVFFIAWWLLQRNKQRETRENAEARKRQEHALRDRVRSDPGYTTFCHQCLFCRRDDKSCQLKVDGEDIREISIGRRTYCPSFRQAASGPPD